MRWDEASKKLLFCLRSLTVESLLERTLTHFMWKAGDTNNWELFIARQIYLWRRFFFSFFKISFSPLSCYACAYDFIVFGKQSCLSAVCRCLDLHFYFQPTISAWVSPRGFCFSLTHSLFFSCSRNEENFHKRRMKLDNRQSMSNKKRKNEWQGWKLYLNLIVNLTCFFKKGLKNSQKQVFQSLFELICFNIKLHF